MKVSSRVEVTSGLGGTNERKRERGRDGGRKQRGKTECMELRVQDGDVEEGSIHRGPSRIFLPTSLDHNEFSIQFILIRILAVG
jgi:hypothetical protein